MMKRTIIYLPLLFLTFSCSNASKHKSMEEAKDACNQWVQASKDFVYVMDQTGEETAAIIKETDEYIVSMGGEGLGENPFDDVLVIKTSTRKCINEPSTKQFIGKEAEEDFFPKSSLAKSTDELSMSNGESNRKGISQHMYDEAIGTGEIKKYFQY